MRLTQRRNAPADQWAAPDSLAPERPLPPCEGGPGRGVGSASRVGAILLEIVGCFILVSACFTPTAAALAQAAMTPVPRTVIYPGEVILDDMLVDAPDDRIDARADSAARTRSLLVGKMARRTLLPGRAIPLAAVDNPRLVVIGTEVRLIYVEGGLRIVTSGAALQDGALGDNVKVRNSDSGVTVSGSVQPDGTVRRGGG